MSPHVSSSVPLPQNSNVVEEFPPGGFGKAILEFPPSGFGKAMSELTAVQGRLADEHEREVSKLQSVNATLISQLSDLQARMDDVTNRYEETAHLALVPKERSDSTNEKCFKDRHDRCSELAILTDPGAAETSVHKEVHLSSVEVVLDVLPEDDRLDDAAVSVDREPSMRTASMLSGRSSVDHETSLRRLTTTASEKIERRAQRLRTALTARLRPVWVQEESDSFVPRWSQRSDLTFSSDDTPVDSMRNYDVPRSQRFLETLKWTLTRSSTWEARKVRISCIVHPQSAFKIMIDFVGILIMGYDFFMTPLMFFNLTNTNFIKLTELMGWVTRIFWTFDMWLNFHIAIYQKGKLVRKFNLIAKNYVKTMFFPDLAIVIAEWVAYILESTRPGGSALENVYLLRVLKVLRFAKVLRIFKFERIVDNFRAQINSTLLLLWLRPLILVFFLLVFNHTLACLWYGIGISSKGWTEHEIQDKSFGYMYMTALHWAISQLHGNMEVFPQNMPERIFMCFNAIVALILYSTFLSSITNGMMELRALRAELHERRTKLRACLARRNISTELTMRIKKRLDYLSSAKTWLDAEASVLSILPKDLLIDLYEESRGPTVLYHSFFSVVSLHGPRIIRQLCHDSMSEASHMPDQIVFSTGDACHCMYFVTRGELLYEFRAGSGSGSTRECSLAMAKTPSTDYSPRVWASEREAAGPAQSVHWGSWLSEAALWMIWEYCGRLTARTPALFLMVNAVSFSNVMTQFHVAHVNSKRHGRHFIECMVRQGLLTDILKEDNNTS